ncbi:DUF397 domain-containing protein [Saccharothrix algeriensis]|uniref:DUF397 domain-containing protein n=1 Tax=Saccharothrix algeriensis TaxID=173560 RepID=A0A8T8I0P0_9PSEU|nr:DUF397 domain-containing protein [Saccharothrix algeriensis]MBM7810092.1 hypothetical protein [Saccharothrix algeriensis]QTR04306.1 DUF397 domain-containing protein [Saccharothrix algeriensis]
MTPDTPTRWRKSSHSGGNGADCVELARTGAGLLVRDSKNPAGAVLAFDRARFAGFLAALRGA